MAYDVGTTTLTGILWDMDSGAELGRAAIGNPQRKYGADVIFRLAVASKGGDAPRKLQAATVDGMTQIMEMFEKEGLLPDRCRVSSFVAVGNSVMQHLLLGDDTAPLSTPPYTPAATGPREVEAARLGLRAAAGARLYMPPCIGGHVGSDITAGLLATGMRGRGGALFVDVGTNGEIALSASGRLLVCSAAAGPAFEGASLSMGMRAEAGAIERIWIRGDEVELKTVGGAPPKGVCGSGAINITAEMLAAGVIDSTGRISTGAELREAGAGDGLAARVAAGKNGRVFMLWGGAQGGVAVTQGDIREIQLAKAAVAAGVKALLLKSGTGAPDVSEVLLAGTFGNNIDIESACGIGIFPGFTPKKAAAAGNAAGDGASLMLLDEGKRREAEVIAASAEHVALAQMPEFQSLLLGEMDF
jgi:uncharacterized 2Fe-2S/4Fe-4S cluster protein (DUF4445 family)